MKSKPSPRYVEAAKKVLSILLSASLGMLAGCGEDNSRSSEQKAPAKHEHKPPHGGTPVVLGSEEHHVELVLNSAEGRMDAYIMDGEMENFQRVGAESLRMAVRLPDQQRSLLFKAVPNTATGEKVGDTSLFEAQADWLKTTKSFDAVLEEIEVGGTTYTNIGFNFPIGNDKDEK